MFSSRANSTGYLLSDIRPKHFRKQFLASFLLFSAFPGPAFHSLLWKVTPMSSLAAFRPQFVTKYRPATDSQRTVLPWAPLPPLSVCPDQTKNLTLDWLFTPKKAVYSCGGASLDQVSPAEVFDRVLARLVQLEAHEPQAHYRDDYRIAWQIVHHSQKGDAVLCMVAVLAWQSVLGVHPDRAYEKHMERRKAILGPKFTQLRKFPSPTAKSQKAKESA